MKYSIQFCVLMALYSLLSHLPSPLPARLPISGPLRSPVDAVVGWADRLVAQDLLGDPAEPGVGVFGGAFA